MAGEKLVEIMRQAARSEQARSSPTDFVYGTVISVNPLMIQPDNKTPLDEDFLVLSALCKPFVTTLLSHQHKESDGDNTDVSLNPVMVWRGLEAGDRVRMLECNSGQKFYVLDREGSLP